MNTSYTKFLFFTGKGGVGKTSLACATAIKIVDEGKKVLLISTDPASNLEDVLSYNVQDKITQHKDLSNLCTININPDSAADQYRIRALAPIKNAATDQEYNKIKEGLSGACTTELASFDEFSRFITGEVIRKISIMLFSIQLLPVTPFDYWNYLLPGIIIWRKIHKEHPVLGLQLRLKAVKSVIKK